MKLTIHSGTYVAAVSGGVDSVVLLDLLSKAAESSKNTLPTRIIVAHFDHGIREDSREDRLLVAELAKKYNYPFVYESIHLGSRASEEAARIARYNFLRKVKEAAGAKAIITGHHSDDAVETAIFNILRGTGRKGVVLEEFNDDIWRPLITYEKSQLYDHAKQHQLEWREDDTNQDTSYSRNHIRHTFLKKAATKQIDELKDKITAISKLNTDIDALLANVYHLQPRKNQIDRRVFASLPHSVAKEFLVYWLRSNVLYSFNAKTIERITVAIKTGMPNSQYDISDGNKLVLSSNTAYLKRT